MERKVLIVEDDPDIAQLIAMHLGDINCSTERVASGDAALAAFAKGGFDLVILDLMLPGLDGLSVCREIRARGGWVPILMLTAKSSELDRVLGLEMGADDYLTKPFSIQELLARIKALFRRIDALAVQAGEAQESKLIQRGDLCIDLEKRKVTLAGKPVDLTTRELDLLAHFARHPGRVYSRTELLDQVWGYSYEGYEHTVNTHINRLRAKIEADPANPHWVETVWGVGYRFREG